MNLFSKLMALWKIRAAAKTIIKEAEMPTATGKPGWKTTEFWMNVATQVGVIWGAVQGLIPEPWAAVIAISGTAVYTIARTVTKAIADVQAAKANVVKS